MIYNYQKQGVCGMLDKNLKKKNSSQKNRAFIAVAVIIFFELVAIGVYFCVKTLSKNDIGNSDNSNEYVIVTEKNNVETDDIQTTTKKTETTVSETNKSETTSKKNETTQNFVSSDYINADIIDYPDDDNSWSLICVNRSRCVEESVENKISLSYVAGSSELMDSRAAVAYEQMYAAAASEGIFLTPCSGYRSYSTQKRLYFEFVNDYLNDGYSESQAHNLASKRRNPPGSSEHNLGICMDIICAASSANFQNTKAFAWLNENAHNYGFILRYPENKVDITGVKFEPWHWRYVGVSNAVAIKSSGLCLEEYLGIA